MSDKSKTSKPASTPATKDHPMTHPCKKEEHRTAKDGKPGAPKPDVGLRRIK